MPIDKIKLDKSLMARFMKYDSTEVLESLVALAHGLKLKVVTEGIETEDEYIKMKRAGSNYLQGYLFSKPVNRKEAEMFLIKKMASAY